MEGFSELFGNATIDLCENSGNVIAILSRRRGNSVGNLKELLTTVKITAKLPLMVDRTTPTLSVNAGVSWEEELALPSSTLPITGSITTSGANCGGISGYIDGGNVINCSNFGSTDIEKDKAELRNTGGITGLIMNGGQVSNCANFGQINGTFNVGGIAGVLANREVNNQVLNCYNAGDISCKTSSAGIVGYIDESVDEQTISFCYNIGQVTLENGLGYGIANVKSIENITIKNCYYLGGTAKGDLNMQGTTQQAEEKTEQEMKEKAFVDLLNNGNEEQIWKEDVDNKNNGYPILNWQ